MTVPDVDERDETLIDDFDAFYARQYRAAVRLAYVLTGDSNAAEDIAQEAFLRVGPRFPLLREPWPYTRAAVINAAKSRHRRSQPGVLPL